MVVVEVRLWIGFGLEWTGTGLGLDRADWLGLDRVATWVTVGKVQCSGGLLGTPLSIWDSSGRKSTAVTLWEETLELFADRNMRGIGQSE